MEKLKSIIGFEGYYEISNLGRVKSLQRPVNCRGGKTRQLKEKILTHNLWNGYLFVHLRKPGFSVSMMVHRAIGMAFIPNPQNKPEVNHKNGKRSDFSLENLEWVTHSENIQHAYDTGLLKNSVKKSDSLRKRMSKSVINVITGEEFTSVIEAAKSKNINTQKLRNMLNGITRNPSEFIYLKTLTHDKS